MPRKHRKDPIPPSSGRVQFDFLKSNFYRVIQPDGAFGGIAPQEGIFAAFYTQRNPIPQSIVHEISPDGKVGPEVRELRTSRGAIVREVEVGVQFSYDVAKAFHAWLGEKVQELEKKQGKAEKERSSSK